MIYYNCIVVIITTDVDIINVTVINKVQFINENLHNSLLYSLTTNLIMTVFDC